MDGLAPGALSVLALGSELGDGGGEGSSVK